METLVMFFFQIFIRSLMLICLLEKSRWKGRCSPGAMHLKRDIKVKLRKYSWNLITSQGTTRQLGAHAAAPAQRPSVGPSSRDKDRSRG